MRIVYVLAGGPRDGLRRYAVLLGRAVGRLEGADVSFVEAEDPGALRRLEGADVVHVQWNPRLVEAGDLPRLVDAVAAAGGPLLVATLHDVYLDDPWYGRRKRRRIGRRVRAWWRARARSRRRRRAFAEILGKAHLALACFDEERRRLEELPGAERVRVLPHFVEERERLPDRQRARRALGLEGIWLVLLGHIHPRKGYDLAVEALAHLPDEVRLALVGEAHGHDRSKLDKCLRRARSLGVADRVRVTGWVEDDEQEFWLSAADVALCPFRFLSASGSLATWISVGRPLVVTPLPQIEELRALEPEAFAVAPAAESAAIARTVLDVLESGRAGGEEPALRRLAERLALGRVARRHVALYEEVAARRARASR